MEFLSQLRLHCDPSLHFLIDEVLVHLLKLPLLLFPSSKPHPSNSAPHEQTTEALEQAQREVGKGHSIMASTLQAYQVPTYLLFEPSGRALCRKRMLLVNGGFPVLPFWSTMTTTTVLTLRGCSPSQCQNSYGSHSAHSFNVRTVMVVIVLQMAAPIPLSMKPLCEILSILLVSLAFEHCVLRATFDPH